MSDEGWVAVGKLLEKWQWQMEVRGFAAGITCGLLLGLIAGFCAHIDLTGGWKRLRETPHEDK